MWPNRPSTQHLGGGRLEKEKQLDGFLELSVLFFPHKVLFAVLAFSPKHLDVVDSSLVAQQIGPLSTA